MANPRPDPTPSAHDRVYRNLRSQIMFGALPPRQTMTLRSIAAEYQVSMTPVREAVQRLVAEGGLTMSQSGRISTPELSADRSEELAALRALLEVELASRALPRAHMALIERLRGINETAAAALDRGEIQTYLKANLEFHRTLYLRAQAPAILAMVETVWLQLGPTTAHRSRRKIGGPPPHHRLILSALRAGDEPGLRLAVRADVTQGLKYLLP